MKKIYFNKIILIEEFILKGSKTTTFNLNDISTKLLNWNQGKGYTYLLSLGFLGTGKEILPYDTNRLFKYKKDKDKVKGFVLTKAGRIFRISPIFNDDKIKWQELVILALERRSTNMTNRAIALKNKDNLGIIYDGQINNWYHYYVIPKKSNSKINLKLDFSRHTGRGNNYSDSYTLEV